MELANQLRRIWSNSGSGKYLGIKLVQYTQTYPHVIVIHQPPFHAGVFIL